MPPNSAPVVTVQLFRFACGGWDDWGVVEVEAASVTKAEAMVHRMAPGKPVVLLSTRESPVHGQ